MEGFGGCFGSCFGDFGAGGDARNAFFAFASSECGWFLKGYLAAWGKGN